MKLFLTRMKIFCFLLILFSTHIVFSQTNDTITTKTGLKYFLTKQGNGKAIDSGLVVVQHYTVWLSNGEKLQSSRDKNTPAGSVYPSDKIIKGANEAISLMKVGDRGKFIMPYYLAYGEKGNSLVPPKETLIFDIEVLETKKSSISKELLDVLYDDSFKVDSIPKTHEAIEKYKSLKRDGFTDLYIGPNDIYIIGFGLLEKFPKDALELFKFWVEENPKSSDAYLHLGNAFNYSGEQKLAIENFKKSLELNPDNLVALEQLKKLGN
ncbi:FKBP-type peptidyl-prolyl cis-trans isomerase [Roseivirga echinicomitans]|nr:FKBP-type peptidyl-prolyl cis-trans isomerase [Roseivirga echinicomitans]